MSKSVSSKVGSFLWDLWCLVSIVGIWPRFIEPKLLKKSRLSLVIPSLPGDLENLRILQFSDLHLNSHTPPRLLKKLLQATQQFSPDLIVFTGDFLCYSVLTEENKDRLHDLLSSFKAPYGCYAVLGNHDYAQFVSVNADGDYDAFDKQGSSLIKGFKRLFSSQTATKKSTPRVKQVGLHQELIKLLQTTPFKLLHNQTTLISIKNTSLNLCGVGEYMLGDVKPDIAFQNYDIRYPGIVLAHNPDAIPKLMDYPGFLILSGHTHGSQINLPWFRNKFMLLENPQYGAGLFALKKEKWAYVNRGLGGVLNFRWRARPEVLLITLKRSP